MPEFDNFVNFCKLFNKIGNFESSVNLDRVTSVEQSEHCAERLDIYACRLC